MPGGSPTLSNGIKRDGDTQPRPRGWGQHPGEHRGSNPNPISPKNKPYRAAPPIPSRPTFLAFFSLRLCLALLMLSSPVPSEWVSGAYGDRDRSNGVGVTKIPRVPRDGGFGALKPPNPIPGSAPAAAPRPRAPPAPGWIRRCSPTRCTTLQKIQKGSGWRCRHHPKKKQNAPKNPKSPPFTFMVGLSPPRRCLVLQ